MKIVKVLFAPGYSAYFFDDQRAIKRGGEKSGFVYEGPPVTPGFDQIREAGECISILLVLEDGQVAIGDAAAVQYSGAGGRDPLFLAETYLPFLKEAIPPLLEGGEAGPFLEMTEKLEALRFQDKSLHTALRYGLSQALLDARAKAQKRMMCEVLCEEFGLSTLSPEIPIFGQCGDDRYDGVDKMIIKEVDVLPHGLVNDIAHKLGRKGEKLQGYLEWIVSRIRKLRKTPAYKPVIHLDVYGTLGLIFNDDAERIADYLGRLEASAKEFPLYIEGPIDCEQKPKQIEAMAELKAKLNKKGIGTKLVADEWCNTYEDVLAFAQNKACHMVQIKTPDLGGIQNVVKAVLYCKAHGMESYQGGTCNETDLSAKACVHAACAAGPERLLAKPGMGFDEGYMLVHNEMARIKALLAYRSMVV